MQDEKIAATGRGRLGESGEGIALAAVILASLVVFPAALILGVLALVRLPPGSGYRRIARLALSLGIVEGMAFSVLLFFLLSHDPFPGRARAAVDQLRKIRKAQAIFKKQVRIDEDGDGIGEFGFLVELAGGRDEDGPDAPVRRPALISRVFRFPTAGGYVEKYGYYFIVYLPDRDWEGAVDGRGDFQPGRGRSDGRESYWIAYAWPAVRDGTARGVYVATGEGIFRSENQCACFDGVARAPRPYSALTGKGLGAGIPIDGRSSVDGEEWTRVE